MKEQIKSLCGAMGYFLIAAYIYVITAGILIVQFCIAFIVTLTLKAYDFMAIVVMGNIICFTVLAPVLVMGTIWALFKSRKRELFKEIFLKPLSKVQVILSIGIGICMWCINIAVWDIAAPIRDLPQQLMRAKDAMGNGVYIYIFLMIVIGGASTLIIREILFRGVIYQALRKGFTAPFAIMIPAVLGSTVHYKSQYFIFDIFLGIAVGYLTYRIQSLGPAIIISVLSMGLNIVLIIYPPNAYSSDSRIQLIVVGVIGALVLMGILIRQGVYTRPPRLLVK